VLPVDADVTQAKAALDKLTTYAKENSLLELRVTTEKAQAAITNVEGMINALSRIRTESQHSVSTNVSDARSQIQSLNGMNTSSTHTIYVQRVEVNASGGLVGAGISHFAEGGAVAPAFPRQSGGSVPGSGNQDTVPRTLDAGAFVLRRAAVQKYGSGALSRLANGVARFASGGSVAANGSGAGVSPVKTNRDVFEARKMIELGLQGMRDYNSWLRTHFASSVSMDMERNTMQTWSRQAVADRGALAPLSGLKQLTSNEKLKMQSIKDRWHKAMAQPMVYGKDLERDLLDYMDQSEGQYYRAGGLSMSDTVPAMLTPGEFVVNRSAVSRFGAGFFESLNQLSIPAQALAQRVQGQIQGFSSGGLVQSMGFAMDRPVLAADAGPIRTVRVELASGNSKVSASIDARDESRLLQLLEVARARSV
jgi:phage-related minor tail protein